MKNVPSAYAAGKEPECKAQGTYRAKNKEKSHAHHMCRETGGRIVILDSQGRWQFTGHAEAGEVDCGF